MSVADLRANAWIDAQNVPRADGTWRHRYVVDLDHAVAAVERAERRAAVAVAATLQTKLRRALGGGS